MSRTAPSSPSPGTSLPQGAGEARSEQNAVVEPVASGGGGSRPAATGDRQEVTPGGGAGFKDRAIIADRGDVTRDPVLEERADRVAAYAKSDAEMVRPHRQLTGDLADWQWLYDEERTAFDCELLAAKEPS